MSNRGPGGGHFLRSSQVADEVTVHVDGTLQSGLVQAPSSPADVQQTESAADIVSTAQMRASELLSEAGREVDVVRDEAYRDGHQQGYVDGVTSGRAEVAEALALVQRAVADGKRLRDQLIAGAEPQIIELVLDAVEQVLGEAARIERGLVLRSVERALERTGAQQVVRIRVHPDDVEVVGIEHRERHGDATAWEVVADGTVGVGGCMINTASGEIDARLDVQLAEIAAALRGAVPHAG